MELNREKKLLNENPVRVLEPITQKIGENIAEEAGISGPRLDDRVNEDAKIVLNNCKVSSGTERELAACLVDGILQWGFDVGELPPKDEIRERLVDEEGVRGMGETISDTIVDTMKSLEMHAKEIEADRVLSE